ncbi:MAG TPA: ParM/StbA family protein, partial [Ktedonobacteraceae bacterium]|nr:ParM/StbA family protein [Ktedonobacteraceae bacterium]
MYYTTYAYGHDYGNSETCGVQISSSGMPQVLIMPSALYTGSYDELVQKVSGSSSMSSLLGILHEQAHTIELHDNQWYVGHLAIEQAPSNMEISSLTSRGDVSRYWSDRSLALLLATSGTLLQDSEYGLAVVTNLPIATHTDTNVKQVKQALTGDHPFTLDGRRRTAHVRLMKTIMEGAGANIAYGPGGQVKVGVIDVGGRTTDAYLVKGQLPLAEQCKSLDTGVESAADAVVAAFERRFAYPLSLSDARALLWCYTHGKHYQTVPTVVNAEVDSRVVDDLITGQLRETGKKIVAFVKRIWASSLSSDVVASDVKSILLIGGGAYYFEQDLRPLFGKRLQVPDHPEHANAL